MKEKHVDRACFGAGAGAGAGTGAAAAADLVWRTVRLSCCAHESPFDAWPRIFM